MEIEKMTSYELETRRQELADLLNNDDCDLDAVETEARAIADELEKRLAQAREEAEQRKKVSNGDGETIKEITKEERKMENIEIRNSKEYVNAYANFIKNGEDKECRALLTENVSGTVPVPELVYDVVKHAWEKEDIMSLVRKTYVRGNLKVGFEISADGAVKHTESANSAVQEESLTLGIVNLTPVSIKKWISISDEALDLSGEEFLRYIYEELSYRIAKKCADELVSAIVACGTQSTTTQVAVPVATITTASINDFTTALGKLSDEASNAVICVNKETWATYKGIQANNKYSYDVFEGRRVIFNNSLKAYSVATTGDCFAIVGDFGFGAQANFPKGEEIEIKVDDKTKMEYDLVRILGREFVGIAPVAPNAFAKLVKG